MEQDKRGAGGADEQQPASAMQDSPDMTASPQTAASGSISDHIAKLNAELDALRSENTELKDKSLRLMAEMENLRRRTERDKSEFSKYAVSEFARDVVSVSDNIRRAIEAVPKDAVENDPALSVLIEGIQVTERELLKALEKYQVKRFDPKGEPFNPHMHDAMTRIDIPNVPADTIVQVIHAGFMIGERVLRPAAVIVAKGGEATDRSQEPGSGHEKAPIPPGAMKVPEDVASSSPAPDLEPRSESRAGGGNALGRDFQTERRRPSTGSDERAAQFRRPRSAVGDQSYSELRPQQNAQGGTKPSALHKPVIGSTKE